MTMMSAKQVIAGLRSKNKKLKDQIEAAIKACHQIATIDVAHRDNELIKLPNRILSILGDKE